MFYLTRYLHCAVNHEQFTPPGGDFTRNDNPHKTIIDPENEYERRMRLLSIHGSINVADIGLEYKGERSGS